MTWLRELVRRLHYLFNRRRLDEALRQEMRAHRELLDRPAAFGNAAVLHEDAVNEWGWRWLDDGLRDLGIAARGLRRRPLFAAVAIGSLALAIGATTAIFTIAYGVLWRPLPFDDPGSLVQVFGRSWRVDRPGTTDPVDGPVGALEQETYARESTTIAAWAGYSTGSAVIEGAEGAERISVVRADATLFDVLGVPPAAGHALDRDSPADSVVISDTLWARRWRRDSTVIGRTISMGGRRLTIVGVMPQEFQFPYRAASILPGALPEARTDAWIREEPVRAATGALRRGRVSLIARLQPPHTVGAAMGDLKAIAARLSGADPRVRYDVRLVPLQESVVGGTRQAIWILFAGAMLVLAAACANVANLLLAQMTVRMREVTTRAMLGAAPFRLARQFLVESVLLSAIAAAVGLAGAAIGLEVLAGVAAPYVPRLHEVRIDWAVFAFVLAIAAATAVGFGLAPALVGWRADTMAWSKEAGQASAGRRFGRARDGLVVIEVALAVVLGFGALLILHEGSRLARTPVGLAVADVLTMHLAPRATADEYQAIVDRVAALPGVRGAAMIQLLPLQHWGWEGDFAIRGAPGDERRIAELRYVTPAYFSTLDIPIVRGRGFSSADSAASLPVVIVNDALVQRYFRGRDPIGVETDRGTIVGVVGNVRQVRLDRPAAPEIYYPIAQNVAVASDAGMSLVVRGHEGVARPVQDAVRAINPRLAVFNVRTMSQIVSDSMAELRLYRWLIGVFATIAIVLTAIGLTGLVAFHVASRSREFAVRLAIGAAPRQLLTLVGRKALWLVALGLGGGALAFVAAMPLVAVLPGIAAARDPLLIASVAFAILGVAAIACLLPALRVLRLQPVVVLRHE